jgi:hypothetical protein
MFAGSKICHNQFTARPFGPAAVLGGDDAPLFLN